MLLATFAANAEENAASSQAVEDKAANRQAQAVNIGELFGLASNGQKPFLLGGYAEILYQWNFNNPSNRITSYRGFDNRHNTFSISNVALDVQWDYKDIVGRLTLQIGDTPNTYYQGEPALPGTSGTAPSGAEVWKYIQQAYAGYRIPLGAGLLAQFGIFLSPIGPEGMPIKDNWNWSRSNLFFGLPFYHAGGKLTYPFTERFSLTAAVYNGWNNVSDNNSEKSLSLQATYAIPDQISVSVLYFTGVERSPGAPEGRAWRHLLDAHVTLRLTPWLEVLAHANGGFEPNAIGVSGWICGAAYLRFQVATPFFIALRGDVFWEHVPTNAAGETASAIFWPVAWVSSGTLTLDYRPIDRISIRLEYRHDHAAGDLYFAGGVRRDFQDTLTLGIVGWF
ncbi:MAG: porin [Deltaproteobacteria bacterium]|nr:porin [Deltaproteobacteria bacterium]